MLSLILMRTLFHCLYLTVFNLHPVGFRCLEFPFSKLLHSKPSSALNRLWNIEWFQAWTLSSKVTSFILYSDCITAVCQRSAVLLWPQLWSPTPPIWESWTWLETELLSCGGSIVTKRGTLTHLNDWSFILASDQLLNTFLHRRRTVDFVLHHLHCKCIMKGSSNGQYEQEEWLWQEKPISMFIWARDCFLRPT